jgi:plasmid maintenance system killer protein
LLLAFAKKSLRRICEKNSVAERKLGKKVAAKLRRRLADLRAAPTARDLAAGQPRIVSSDQMVVDLGRGYRLRFEPNHNRIQRTDSGDIAWDEVTRVLITKLENDDE